MSTRFPALRRGYLNLVSDPSPGSAKRLAHGLLKALSVGYRSGVAVRNWLYDNGLKEVYEPTLPVISVGNITTGGTGKTPLVAYLARWLAHHGMRVVILSRGYGAGPDGELNDEGKVLKRLAPSAIQLQGRDRVALARYAEEHFGPAVLLLDDGFQHRRLHRHLDLVLVDATNPFGHGALLPRGLLREPATALQRADFLVLTRGNQVTSRRRFELRQELNRLSGNKPLIEATVEPVAWVSPAGQRLRLHELHARRALAFCGIGNPRAFLRQLEELGCQVVESVIFPDHHRYRPSDLQRIRRLAADCGADCLVTTEKDLVKLPPRAFTRIPIYALRIELRLMTGAKLLHATLRQLARLCASVPLQRVA